LPFGEASVSPTVALPKLQENANGRTVVWNCACQIIAGLREVPAFTVSWDRCRVEMPYLRYGNGDAGAARTQKRQTHATQTTGASTDSTRLGHHTGGHRRMGNDRRQARTVSNVYRTSQRNQRVRPSRPEADRTKRSDTVEACRLSPRRWLCSGWRHGDA